jgi:hypothetical protein
VLRILSADYPGLLSSVLECYPKFDLLYRLLLDAILPLMLAAAVIAALLILRPRAAGESDELVSCH